MSLTVEQRTRFFREAQKIKTECINTTKTKFLENKTNILASETIEEQTKELSEKCYNLLTKKIKQTYNKKEFTELVSIFLQQEISFFHTPFGFQKDMETFLKGLEQNPKSSF